MSRFDDLDHRLGLHEDTPHPDCSICNPDRAAVNAATLEPRLITSVRPAFPNWGDIWLDGDTMRVFVSPTQRTEGGGGANEGFWTRLYWPVEGLRNEAVMIWDDVESQLEFGSGRWGPNVKTLAMANSIPNESIDSSPMGVNLADWAWKQNRAKLLVEMQRGEWFPVSMVVNEQHLNPLLNATDMRSTVQVISVQPLRGT